MTMTSTRISALAEKFSQALEDNDTLIAVCQDIVLEIQSGRSKVHSVVEELRPYLTNNNVTVRANGVKTLSVVLSKLPKDYLDESEIWLLTAFYCDRLKDHHSIGPATILGILAITSALDKGHQASQREAGDFPWPYLICM